MTAKIHKPGIHENHLLNRHQKLEGVNEAVSEQVIEQFSKFPEVNEAVSEQVIEQFSKFPEVEEASFKAFYG